MVAGRRSDRRRPVGESERGGPGGPRPL